MLYVQRQVGLCPPAGSAASEEREHYNIAGRPAPEKVLRNAVGFGQVSIGSKTKKSSEPLSDLVASRYPRAPKAPTAPKGILVESMAVRLLHARPNIMYYVYGRSQLTLPSGDEHRYSSGSRMYKLSTGDGCGRTIHSYGRDHTVTRE